MPENQLIDNAIRYGIAGPPLRATLRDMRTDMLTAGTGTSLGVHDFGVFYVVHQPRRFVMRDSKLYDIPARDVLKLRPKKSVAVELTESIKVRCDLFFDKLSPPGTIHYQFESTSRATDFSTVSPSPEVGKTFRLWHHTFFNMKTLILARDDVSKATAENVIGMKWTAQDGELQVMRIGYNGLTCYPEALSENLNADLKAVQFGAVTNTDGGYHLITEPTIHGREAIGWFRQRTKKNSEIT